MNLEELLVILVKELKEKGIEQSLALVGSAIENDKYNDVDFLMVVEDIINIKSKILNSMGEYKVSICDDAIKFYNYKGNMISIALYSKIKVNNIVDNFMSGNNYEPTHRTWCLGYWIPESFIENLKRMRIINDPNNYLENIKNKLYKDHIYAKKTIIKACLEEIKIKYNYLCKTNKDSLEYSFYKNDIILCVIRGLKILNNEFLVSYKRIEKEIELLNSKDLNNIINDDLNSINNIIDLFQKFISYSDSLYLGTWQFSGDFKQLTEDEIIALIKYSKEKGVNRFDTALVYGKGKVERILGKVLELDDKILTKVPAKEKPPKENPDALDNYYDYEYILKCVKESCTNLNREYIDICLLHNWTLDWNNETKLIEYLLRLKETGLVKKIGISLPNGYNNVLSPNVLQVVDVVEAPYNKENKWIVDSINEYKKYSVEIILRSLFLQGREDKTIYNNILEQALSLETSLVIGMTTKEQINENISRTKRGSK